MIDDFMSHSQSKKLMFPPFLLSFCHILVVSLRLSYPHCPLYEYLAFLPPSFSLKPKSRCSQDSVLNPSHTHFITERRKEGSLSPLQRDPTRMARGDWELAFLTNSLEEVVYHTNLKTTLFGKAFTLFLPSAMVRNTLICFTSQIDTYTIYNQLRKFHGIWLTLITFFSTALQSLPHYCTLFHFKKCQLHPAISFTNQLAV